VVVHACTYLLSSVVNPRCLGAADLDEAERAADRTGAAGQQLFWIQSTCAAIVAPHLRLIASSRQCPSTPPARAKGVSTA